MYDWRFKAFGRLEAPHKVNCIAPWRSAPYHPVEVLFNGLRPTPLDATVTGTKWIEFESHDFWVYDVAAGVFLKHRIDEAEASGHADTPWLSKAVS
jgi:hypothetical protein